MWKVNIKRKTQSAKGEPLDPPVVLDGNKEPMDPTDVKSIGNGCLLYTSPSPRDS